MNIPNRYIEPSLFVLFPLLSAALVISLGFALFGMPSYTSIPKTSIQTAVAALTVPSVHLPRTLSEEIMARSAIVYDITEKKTLFAKDADMPRPLASLTKLMSALVAYDNLSHKKRVAIVDMGDDTQSSGTLSLPDALAYLLVGSKNAETEQVALTANALFAASIESRSPSPSALPTSPKTEDVTEGDTPTSSSDASGITSGPDIPYFLEHLNTRARALHMTQTRFYNSTGLDLSEREAGAYGSAHDVALLLAYLSNRSDLSFLEATTEPVFSAETISGEAVTTENTNEIVGAIPGLMFSKTGYTDLAGGNLAVVFDAGLNHPVAVVVLGSTLEGRFNDVKHLVDETLRVMQEK